MVSPLVKRRRACTNSFAAALIFHSNFNQISKKILPAVTLYKKIFFLSITIAIAAICLSYVAFSFDWQTIAAVLRRADWLLFVVGSVLTIISYWLLRAWRWSVLLSAETVRIRFAELYLYTAVTVGLSTITPFQAGEALKVEMLKKHGANRASGYSIFLIERMLDLAIVLLLALVGLQGELSRQFAFPIQILIAVGAVGAAILLAAVFLIPNQRLISVRAWIRARLQIQILLPAILLTIGSWLMVVLGWKLAVQSVGVNLNFFQSLVFVSLTTLIAIISFVPGAIGVSEISATNILTNFGYETGLAQTGAVILRGYALMIILLALVHLILLNSSARRLTPVFTSGSEKIEANPNAETG